MVLYIFLIAYSVIEIIILRTFFIKKEKVAIKTTIVSFVFLWLVFVATLVFDFKIPDVAFIFTIIAFLIHSFFGYYLNLYNKSKFFDRIAHGIGSFSLSIFAYCILSNFLEYGGSKTFQVFYIFLLGVSLGTIYEIVEFIEDKNKQQKLQRGLKDTDNDMISDIVGSIAAAMAAYLILL